MATFFIVLIIRCTKLNLPFIHGHHVLERYQMAIWTLFIQRLHHTYTFHAIFKILELSSLILVEFVFQLHLLHKSSQVLRYYILLQLLHRTRSPSFFLDTFLVIHSDIMCYRNSLHERPVDTWTAVLNLRNGCMSHIIYIPAIYFP